MTSKLTDEETELLINLVKQYPVLYSSKDQSYYSNNMKEHAWKVIADILKKTVSAYTDINIKENV